jgi:diketogulonate reductase-like aldo/keto reductase
MKNENDFSKVWAQIVTKAWTDEKFKKRLLQNPKEVLKEFGIDTSKVDYTIIEDTDSKRTLVLPRKNFNLSEEEMKKMNAGRMPDDFVMDG